MLELCLSGVISGVAIKNIGLKALPILLLYGMARLDVGGWNWKKSNLNKIIGLTTLFSIGVGLGFARDAHTKDWFQRDGSTGALKGSYPGHSQPKRFSSFEKLYLYNNASPTFDGWSQKGFVDGQMAILVGSGEETAWPAGSWVIAKCRSTPTAHFFCTPLPDGLLTKGPTSISHRISSARLRTTSRFIQDERGGIGHRYSASLATGARALIPPAEVDRLARLGLLHLWAVSGLHVLLVAGFILFVVQRVYLRLFRDRTRPAPAVVAGFCALPFVYLYASFCGFGPSVIRASIAFTIFVLFRWARRSLNAASVLMLTLTLELTGPTEEILRAGSLLSHSAVLGIILVFSSQKQKNPSDNRGFKWAILKLAKTGFAATLATAPFQVLYFGSLAPAGTILGIFMVPIFALGVLPLCLLTAILIVLAAPQFLVAAFVWASSQIMSVIHDLLCWLDRPGLRITISSEHSLLCACVVIALFWMWLQPQRFKAITLALAIFFCVIGLLPHKAYSDGSLSVRAFDVGHGDAFLITTARGTTLLVDTGPGSPNGRGARLSPERLRRLGITQIDVLVLSHRHPDHYGGAFRLLHDIPVRRCILPHKAIPTQSSLWRSLLHTFHALDLNCQSVQAGNKLQIYDLNIEFLAPLTSEDFLIPEDAKDENNWSLAAHISTENGHIWAFGDAPKELEIDIMALNPTLATGGVLLVPHHGSNTSSSAELLDRLRPGAAVVSHKRPLPKTVAARYRARHIPMCGTSPSGTVHLRLRKGRIWVPNGCNSH